MKGRDYDNDRGYRSPRAWFKLKGLFDHMRNGLPQLARHVERLSDEHGTCVRLVLAAAVHAFAAMTPEERKHALMAYHSWDRKSPPRRPAKPEAPQPTAPTPTIPLDDDDNDPSEAWKRGGGGVAEWHGDAKLPGWLTWLRELVFIPYGKGGRRIEIFPDDHRIECTPNIHLGELRDAIARCRRNAPDEDLPPDEQVSDDAFNRAAWSILAPPGWPYPPNLPETGVKLSEPVRPGWPPTIYTEQKGPLTMCCPHCGTPYADHNALRRHLVKRHGWEETAQGLTPPPVPNPTQARKAA